MTSCLVLICFTPRAKKAAFLMLKDENACFQRQQQQVNQRLSFPFCPLKVFMSGLWSRTVPQSLEHLPARRRPITYRNRRLKTATKISATARGWRNSKKGSQEKTQATVTFVGKSNVLSLASTQSHCCPSRPPVACCPKLMSAMLSPLQTYAQRRFLLKSREVKDGACCRHLSCPRLENATGRPKALPVRALLIMHDGARSFACLTTEEESPNFSPLSRRML